MTDGPAHRRALALLAAAALLVPGCRPVEAGGGADLPPTVSASPTRQAKPSGRRPGVVNIDTERALDRTRAAGTGIVLDTSGLVLTNNHVIAGATRIKGTDTDNRRTYRAKVVGYDKTGDIAVIRLTGASGLRPAAFAPADGGARVGDPVTAVGNAGGRGGTPTVVTGRVTALGQTVTARNESDGGAERLSDLIETNAPIRPGHSGGPLLDTAGRVIGMNTAASTGRTADGRKRKGAHRGYAIPADRVLAVARQIQRGEPSSTVHIGPTALLGVKVRGAARGRGATVIEVVPDTPAADAGVPVGVTVTALGGRPVDSPATLSALMLAHHPGDSVRLDWTGRDGRPGSVFLRLTEGPPQ
ncbi:S1C family serine protease [Spirillospora albida]|uniref:S1C family serine protease n=1 Tax=Spirillospora albida TaxID=58123 RepID=UPI0004C020E6|nr:trypsin-like peptidase domain-containing protein [Spirillospora albida]